MDFLFVGVSESLSALSFPAILLMSISSSDEANKSSSSVGGLGG